MEYNYFVIFSFLATGDGLQSIALCYRTGRSTISGIIKETCEAIWECFHEEELLTPAQNRWQNIALEFQEMWNFPNCIGALDGKHVAVIVSFYYYYILNKMQKIL